jgi:hypothetical protein
MNMRTNISARGAVIIAAMVSVMAVAFNGCADYASIGVASGYAPAYYVPDYRPYFSAYYYDGTPWWGPNAYYVRKKVIVKDVDKHVDVNRNIYYGTHHLVRDRHRTRSFARDSRRR